MGYVPAALAAVLLVLLLVVGLRTDYVVVGMLPVLGGTVFLAGAQTVRRAREEARHQPPSSVLARARQLQPLREGRADEWLEGGSTERSGTLVLGAETLHWLDWTSGEEVEIALSEIDWVASAKRYSTGEPRIWSRMMSAGHPVNAIVVHWRDGTAQWWLDERIRWRWEIGRAAARARRAQAG